MRRFWLKCPYCKQTFPEGQKLPEYGLETGYRRLRNHIYAEHKPFSGAVANWEKDIPPVEVCGLD